MHRVPHRTRRLLGASAVLTLLAGGVPARAVQVASTHPRLLVRADDARVGTGATVSELRRRRAGAELAPYARQDTDDTNWEGILTPALQALLGGDAASQARVRAWLLEQTEPPKRSVGRQGPGHMAVAFDWIHATLPPADRRQIAENLRTGTDAALAFLRLGEPDINHNFTYMALFSLTAAGLVLHDEPGFEAIGAAYLHEVQDWLAGPGGVYEACAARGGAWGEGGQYSFTECTRLLVMTLHAFRTATDTDPFVEIHARHGDFLRGTGRFYMAMTRPDFTLERLGDMNQLKPLLRDQHRFVVEALAAGLCGDGGDARVPAMLEHFSDLLHVRYGWRDTHRNHAWGMLVFADPDSPRDPGAYGAQPFLQVFGRGTLDFAVLRHGWDEDGTMITFQGGDHYVDHQHFDKGSFTIYHRGALAIDSGAYDRMDSAHHRQWATRTIAHDAPLVLDPEQPVPLGFERDGGQRVLRGLQHHARWTEFLAHRDAEHLDAADLERADSGWAPALGAAGAPGRAGSDGDPSPAAFSQWAVVQAQLGGAYGPSVRSLRRTLAYWPSAQVVVVDDAFELASPLGVTFVLHTQEPLLAAGAAGGTGTATRAAATSSEVRAEAARAAPGDLALDGVDWWVTTCRGGIDLGAHQIAYDGRLFLRTVSPRAHRARRVGGRGFEWWLHGKNYKPAGDAGEPRESGAWRVEVSPVEPAVRQHVVHALLLADPSVFAMPEAAPLATGNGWRGTHVASAPEVALLVPDGSGALPLRYEIRTALPCLHLVVGLEPERPVAVRAGKSSRVLAASVEGVLAFHDPEVGSHALVLESAATR